MHTARTLAWRHLGIGLLLVLGAVPSARARGDVLVGTWKSTAFPNSNGGVAQVLTGVRRVWYYGPDPFASINLFEGITLRPGDAGRTFEANAANDPHFTAFVANLSNGVNNTIGVAHVYVPGLSIPWSASVHDEQTFANYPGASGHWDFASTPITRIVMRIDRAVMVSPGSNPNGDGNWTDYNFAHTLLFYSEVPEPGAVPTATLCGLAACGVRWRRRRRRR